MISINLLPVLAFAVTTVVAGSNPFTKTISTKTELKCSTYYGSKSVAPPLQTSISTKTMTLLPWFGTSVYTPIVTVTPAPVTQTDTVEETTVVTITDSTVTDIFSTTLTETITETATVQTTSFTTKVDLFTATETAPESTSIIPTSTGFLPIESTVATQYPNAPSKRFSARGNGKKPDHGDKDVCKDKFPQKVTCTNWVLEYPTIIYVKTAKASTITLPPATATAFSTVVVTSTSTVVPPNVSTTSSFTATATAHSTITNTEVSTIQSASTTTLTLTHTTSVYAACTPGSKNFLGPDRVSQGYLLGISGTNNFLITRPGNQYNCCVECQNNPKCAGSIYKTGPEPASEVGQCLQIQSQTCNNAPGFANQAQFSRAYFTIQQDIKWGAAWSNGNCGYLYYGGPF